MNLSIPRDPLEVPVFTPLTTGVEWISKSVTGVTGVTLMLSKLESQQTATLPRDLASVL
jgi:hypothetical protein